MKLQEITHKKGTYVGLRVLDPASSLLYEHCKNAGIDVKKSYFDRRLHMTVIYSRNHCPKLQVFPDIKYVCNFVAYDIFGEGDERILVAKFNAPLVTARHLYLMAENNATYDYPVFQPHITLTYEFKGKDTLGIPPIDFPVILGEEYTEDLKLDWDGK